MFDLRTDPFSEPLNTHALVSEFAVGRLIAMVLPRLSRIDVRYVDATLRQALERSTGRELRPVVRSQVSWTTVHTHHPPQHFDESGGADTAADVDHWAFPGAPVHVSGN